MQTLLKPSPQDNSPACGGIDGAADKRGPSSGEKGAERSEADEVEKLLSIIHQWLLTILKSLNNHNIVEPDRLLTPHPSQPTVAPPSPPRGRLEEILCCSKWENHLGGEGLRNLIFSTSIFPRKTPALSEKKAGVTNICPFYAASRRSRALRGLAHRHARHPHGHFHKPVAFTQN